ncbi:MAG: two-component system response regulator [Elusimicrobia bacterium HGW-Elusimicrobia-3]|jgi:CheY-like chemotaxis protein|nr:MAG: two-component system response regulator [Elusimicrobia bacterium HGW-Elusimicrobia-3]
MKAKRLKILSIEDDPGCQKAMSRFMTTVGGHAVEIAGTGTEGLEKAARLNPDLILLDMMLPDMSGMEVMDKLSAEPATSRIPVIIVTGASLNESQRKDLGARENFMRLEEKPAGMTDLLKVIDLLQDAGTKSGADSRPWPDIEGTICGY